MIDGIFEQPKYSKTGDDDIDKILNELDKTRKFREWAGRLPGRFMKWLESGSLIPFLILISIYNIAIVLTYHYPWPIAAAVAVLIDIAIYQNIMAIRKRTGKFLYGFITWLVFFFSLAYSVYLHLQFYYPILPIFNTLTNAVVYSSLIPFSIFGIAWRLYVQYRAEECEKAVKESSEIDAKKHEKNNVKSNAKNTEKSGIEIAIESGEKSSEKNAIESSTKTAGQNGEKNGTKSAIENRTDIAGKSGNVIAKKSDEKTRTRSRKKQKKKREKKREKVVKVKDGICLVCGAKKVFFKPPKWAAHFNQKSHRNWTPEMEVKDDSESRNKRIITS